MMDRNINLIFLTQDDTKYTVTVKDVKEDVTDAEISALMDKIILHDIFRPMGAKLVQKVSAKIVEKTQNSVDL